MIKEAVPADADLRVRARVVYGRPATEMLSHDQKRRIKPDIAVAGRHQETPAWSQTEKREDKRAPLPQVSHVKRNKEVWSSAWLGTGPDVPSRCLAYRLMPKSIDRKQASPDIRRNANALTLQHLQKLSTITRAQAPLFVQ